MTRDGYDATPPCPSPLAGDGKGEGAHQTAALTSTSSPIRSRSPHPTDAFGVGHLLPRGEKVNRFSASDLSNAFFWINLAQRRDRLS